MDLDGRLSEVAGYLSRPFIPYPMNLKSENVSNWEYASGPSTACVTLRGLMYPRLHAYALSYTRRSVGPESMHRVGRWREVTHALFSRADCPGGTATFNRSW